MPERVEIVPCRVRYRKGRTQVLPAYAADPLGPGDRKKVVRQNGRVSIVIHRAGFWGRLKARLRG